MIFDAHPTSSYRLARADGASAIRVRAVPDWDDHLLKLGHLTRHRFRPRCRGRPHWPVRGQCPNARTVNVCSRLDVGSEAALNCSECYEVARGAISQTRTPFLVRSPAHPAVVVASRWLVAQDVVVLGPKSMD